MTKRGKVYYREIFAGIIEEREEGFYFSYDSLYLELEGAMPVSLTLPLTDKTYKNNQLFPFFDGLIPEGWLLDLASNNWKIDQEDRMSLLLMCCKDCIGSVSVIPDEVIDE
jgi:serine/threonine-protein kinase HipA